MQQIPNSKFRHSIERTNRWLLLYSWQRVKWVFLLLLFPRRVTCGEMKETSLSDLVKKLLFLHPNKQNEECSIFVPLSQAYNNKSKTHKHKIIFSFFLVNVIGLKLFLLTTLNIFYWKSWKPILHPKSS